MSMTDFVCLFVFFSFSPRGQTGSRRRTGRRWRRGLHRRKRSTSPLTRPPFSQRYASVAGQAHWKELSVAYSQLRQTMLGPEETLLFFWMVSYWTLCFPNFVFIMVCFSFLEEELWQVLLNDIVTHIHDWPNSLKLFFVWIYEPVHSRTRQMWYHPSLMKHCQFEGST